MTPTLERDEIILEKPVELLPMKWRGLLFNKSGASYRGISIFDTETECMDFIRSKVDWLKIPIPEGKGLKTLDGNLSDYDYSWHMAIPVLL